MWLVYSNKGDNKTVWPGQARACYRFSVVQVLILGLFIGVIRTGGAAFHLWNQMRYLEGHTYLTVNSSLCASHHIQYTQSWLSSIFPFKADSQLSQAIAGSSEGPLLRYPVACPLQSSSCGCESIHQHHLHHTTTQGKLILNVAKCLWSHPLKSCGNVVAKCPSGSLVEVQTA